MRHCYTCHAVSQMEFCVNGHLDEPCISFCCEHYEGLPKLTLSDSVDETIRKFVALRNDMLSAGEMYYLHGLDVAGLEILEGCLKCARFQLQEYPANDKVCFVNLSMYPAPCQSKCTYCDFRKKPAMMRIGQEDQLKYERLLELLHEIKNRALTAPDLLWQVSSGEFSIHPYSQRILDLIRDDRSIIYSNGFLFDSDIAQVLRVNPGNAINVSLDAGVSSTWKKVKGFDNFLHVVDNLKRYAEEASAAQIILKYILLPDVNDGNADFKGVIDVMRFIGIDKLIITPDFNSDHMEKDLLRAEPLMRMLKKQNMSYEVYLY